MVVPAAAAPAGLLAGLQCNWLAPLSPLPPLGSAVAGLQPKKMQEHARMPRKRKRYSLAAGLAAAGLALHRSSVEPEMGAPICHS